MLSETVHGRLLVTRNAQLTRRHAIKADWLVVLSRSRLQAVFRLFLVSLVVSFVWVQARPRWAAGLGSGGTRPNRTGLNHQPQNSKAREGQPSAGSNPAATASKRLVRPYGTVDGENMIKIIANMPTGTIGVEAVGKVTEEDYRDVLIPAIGTALERNDVRLLYVLDEDFGSYSPGAMWADTKLWAQHLKAWRKIAIVSDADWLENSVKAFGWLIPGEVKVFESDDLDDAKEWLSGVDDDDDD